MNSDIREKVREIMEGEFPGVFDSMAITEQDRLVEEYQRDGGFSTTKGILSDNPTQLRQKPGADEVDFEMVDKDEKKGKK